jgi:hypothetical protein
MHAPQAGAICPILSLVPEGEHHLRRYLVMSQLSLTRVSESVKGTVVTPFSLPWLGQSLNKAANPRPQRLHMALTVKPTWASRSQASRPSNIGFQNSQRVTQAPG